LAQRCRIVLARAAGLTNQEVAAAEGAHQGTVGKWRARFLEKRPDGLQDEPRPGGPRSISDADVKRVLVKAGASICHARPTKPRAQLEVPVIHTVFKRARDSLNVTSQRLAVQGWHEDQRRVQVRRHCAAREGHFPLHYRDHRVTKMQHANPSHGEILHGDFTADGDNRQVPGR
jgi:hypothetical protein